MKAGKDNVVAVSYELNVEGQVADKAPSERPLEYIHGTGMLLPKFEAALEGKQPGETFDFILSPEDGYGQYDSRYLVDIPKEAFMIDGEVKEEFLVVGKVIPMLNSDGQVVQGTVSEVVEKSVKMDFNHPMAGKTLHFTGKVESVRKATEKELSEGLHGEFLPREEGCCGGGCHGGCEGGCEGDCKEEHGGKCKGEHKDGCKGGCHSK